MTSLGIFALLLCLSTSFGIINDRTLRLPSTIGILLFAMLTSLALMGLNAILPDYDLASMPMHLLKVADLPGNLLDGALSFLLFAGALQVDVEALLERKFSILFLAILGTLLAVALLGSTMWCVMVMVGLPVPFLWCVILGAILAPTDPVSVVGMLRQLGLPRPIQAVFAGESLLNDGVGIVVFSLAMTLATGENQHVGIADVLRAFSIEAIGGSLLGLALGWVGILALRLTREHQLQLLVSLSLAAGTFSLAHELGMSGPIAVVMAGFCLASERARRAMDEEARCELINFWDLIDEILNALLFLLIGLEVLAVMPGRHGFYALLMGIPLSILARGLSVFLAILPIHLLGAERGRALAVLTWGGLRGGISLSLALSLPPGHMRDILAPVSYGIVVFTILVQGLTMSRVALYFYPPEEQKAAHSD